jgi:NAD(P)-dependent dehydrogenase (short-subunit alcohol dehydrogenase family)
VIDNYNPFSLAGKTILITGASSGIGRATAVECSKMGAQVVVTARNEERLKETLDMLHGSGHQLFVADLSSEEEIDRLVAELPKINGCVNNAGCSVRQLVPFIKTESIHTILEVNLVAPISLTQKLVKNKSIANGASIVFTSSIAKFSISPGNGLYAASKGGLSAFMKNAAIDLAGKKIRCNAVLPGIVETPLVDGKSAITEEQWESYRQLHPLKRFGNPEDIAFAIIYLLSDASSWVTGTELVIDGGRTLR